MRALSVCGALKVEDLHRLDRILTHVRVAPGQVVFMEADPADHLFVLTEGCVKIYKLLADGRRQITGFLYPSDFLGLALLDQYAYTAEAVTESALCRFPRRQLEGLLEEFPELEKRLLGVASNELASAQDQMMLLGRKTAEEKVVSFMLMLERRAAQRGASAPGIELPMSRADIADHLGLTTETVSRCFTRLRDKSLISFSNPHVVNVRDRGAMAEIAGLDDDAPALSAWRA